MIAEERRFVLSEIARLQFEDLRDDLDTLDPTATAAALKITTKTLSTLDLRPSEIRPGTLRYRRADVRVFLDSTRK